MPQQPSSGLKPERTRWNVQWLSNSCSLWVQPVSTEELRTDDTSCPSRTYADHFMSQDHSHWPFRIWTFWCHSVTTCWQPFRWTLWCHQDEDDGKSTTERNLSVPWAPLYSLLVITSHPRSFSPPLSLVSHHISCYTALSLLASKCFFVCSCELSCLLACSMWSRGSWLGGSLVSRIVLCCFTHSTVWQCDVCVFVFSFVLFPAIPIPELIQCYHLTFFISLWTGPPITFQVACLFCLGGLFGLFGFWFCFCCFWCGCAFCCFSQWIVTAAGLCTGPLPVHFCGFHPWWRLLVCIN